MTNTDHEDYHKEDLQEIKELRQNDTLEIVEIVGTQIIKNETFLQCFHECGANPQFITIKLNTIELLEWLNIKDLKDEAIKHINNL